MGDFNEGASGKILLQERESGVALPLDGGAIRRWCRVPLLESSLSNGIGHLQAVQRKKEYRRAAEATVTGYGRRRSRLLRQEFHQEAGVGVGPHRRDSRTIFE